MSKSAGQKYYNEIKNFKKQETIINSDIIDYLFDKIKPTKINNLEEFRKLKKQHIIKYDCFYFRKVNGEDKIYKICVNLNRILLDKENDDSNIDITLSNVAKLSYLEIPTKLVTKNTEVYHGTWYQLPIMSDHMPHNWAGNWFGIDLGESLSYTFGDGNARLYKYKVKEDFNVLNIPNETGIEYFFIHIAFMEIKIEDNDIKIKVEYARGINKPSGIMIDKYNYTEGKNILKPCGNNQYGLFNDDNLKISDNFFTTINLASSGDNDKQLAGSVCNIYNSRNDLFSIQINGWMIEEINHLMICNPLEVLENIAGSKGFGLDGNISSFIDKGTKGYTDYFQKYIKYKTKYLNLKKLNNI
jgi:hypothetical protein